MRIASPSEFYYGGGVPPFVVVIQEKRRQQSLSLSFLYPVIWQRTQWTAGILPAKL
jgi:hypothetical protein